MRTTLGRLLTGLSAALLLASTPALATPAAGAEPAALPALVPALAPMPATATVGALASGRPAKVTVPSNYVYNPKLGALHDYCTFAPDEFPAPKAANADFRGPCARHDLCYAGSASQKSCDKALRRNMFQNCEHWYGRFNPLRTGCKVVALTYWTAVVAG
ncbi:MAG TPA: hypothetical protein VLL08_24270 [Kineosporiaceae bacterium]|nr:hypothetical protein [Kineosporiaceae bacterium]